MIIRPFNYQIQNAVKIFRSEDFYHQLVPYNGVVIQRSGIYVSYVAIVLGIGYIGE